MADPNHLNDSVSKFYVDWRMRMFHETEVLPKHWENLTPDQKALWMLAFAATVEVGARMAIAVGSVLEDSDGN